MKVNKLSFKTEEKKGTHFSILWFELLVDDESIEKYIGEDKAIPYNYFENYYFEKDTNDLPFQLNYKGKYKDKKLYLIGVCTCGEAGCGSNECEIIKDQDYVELKVFYPSSGYQPPEEIKFKFARENYESVVSEIKRQAKVYKEAREN